MSTANKAFVLWLTGLSGSGKSTIVKRVYVLLVEAGGGRVADKEGNKFIFNCQNTLISGLVACKEVLFDQLDTLIQIRIPQK